MLLHTVAGGCGGWPRGGVNSARITMTRMAVEIVKITLYMMLGWDRCMGHYSGSSDCSRVATYASIMSVLWKRLVYEVATASHKALS